MDAPGGGEGRVGPHTPHAATTALSTAPGGGGRGSGGPPRARLGAKASPMSPMSFPLTAGGKGRSGSALLPPPFFLTETRRKYSAYSEICPHLHKLPLSSIHCPRLLPVERFEFGLLSFTMRQSFPVTTLRERMVHIAILEVRKERACGGHKGTAHSVACPRFCSSIA